MSLIEPVEGENTAFGPSSRKVVAGMALVMAVIAIYMPSPLFPVISDNDTYRALGWVRDDEGAWSNFVNWLRLQGKSINRTLLDPAIIRPFFVGASCAIALLTTSPWKLNSALSWRLAIVLDGILLLMLAFGLWVLARKLSHGPDVLFIPETVDIVAALFGVVVVAELTRRLAGWFMFSLIVLAVLYMKFGAPEWLFYRTAPKTWDLLAINFWLETTGAMGFALSIMLKNVVIFILFGVIIQATGATDSLLRIALAATRNLRGGPAHAAILSSAMFGTFSGSAAANVVGTGTFTIPLIKSRGFAGRFAGGVEAAASTGGQIMPPVMGAAAFYLAEQAQIPYAQVAVAVLIPALFYFGSLFVSVELQARRDGIRVAGGKERIHLTREDWVKSLAFFAPLVAIIYSLAAGYSINRAGFWAITATIVFGLLNRDFRNNFGRIWGKLIVGGIAVARLLSIVAGLGVFIGVVEGTGLGPKIGTDMALLVDDNILLALMLTMVASLVLSMGMPTLPAYATIITIMGVFLAQLADAGTPILAVHLFVIYFGVLSPVTPPVALAAYAAAPIASAHPFETALSALRLCFVAFIIPYAFFFNPQLLFGQVDFEAVQFLTAVVILALCVWSITSGMVGWSLRPIAVWERALRVAAGIGLVASDPIVLWLCAGLLVGHHAFEALTLAGRVRTLRRRKPS